MAKRDLTKLPESYPDLLEGIASLIDESRSVAARSVNSIMTATYWEIGRRIVEVEQGGTERAEYGKELVKNIAKDLKNRFGRGFSQRNLEQMRRFYLAWPIAQTLSAQFQESPSADKLDSKAQTLSAQSEASEIQQTPSGISQTWQKQALNARFPLPWSHYVKLLTVDDSQARNFYEQEALTGGWSVRQLSRQIGSQFYERTLLSKNKQAMLEKGSQPETGDLITAEQTLKNSFVLEFLDLKDEYSESELEDALIQKLEEFLLELGNDFTFVGRQKRLRIGDQWFRVDLIFFHRRLRCLVVIDLKIGTFSHADAGQMHMYLNYAASHWTHEDENPPVGLILCANKNEAVAHYALDGLPNTVMAAEYKLALPDEKLLVEELKRTQRAIDEMRANEDTE